MLYLSDIFKYQVLIIFETIKPTQNDEFKMQKVGEFNIGRQNVNLNRMAFSDIFQGILDIHKNDLSMWER